MPRYSLYVCSYIFVILIWFINVSITVLFNERMWITCIPDNDILMYDIGSITACRSRKGWQNLYTYMPGSVSTHRQVGGGVPKMALLASPKTTSQLMPPFHTDHEYHESPNIFVAIRGIRGLCGMGA